MELAALCLVVFALGVVIGYEWGSRSGKTQRADTPIPDYDPENPINANGPRGEVVNICGSDWVRMN